VNAGLFAAECRIPYGAKMLINATIHHVRTHEISITADAPFVQRLCNHYCCLARLLWCTHHHHLFVIVSASSRACVSVIRSRSGISQPRASLRSIHRSTIVRCLKKIHIKLQDESSSIALVWWRNRLRAVTHTSQCRADRRHST
jgi:hypothetical protein